MARTHMLRGFGLLLAALSTSPAAAQNRTQDPLPRFEDALCPGVTGMRTDAALQIVDRIRYNADRLGIRLADPSNCSPNLLIAFVEDGSETIDQLMASQPRLFETLTMPDRRELRAAPGPARAWNVVVTRTRDGMWVPRRENLVQIPEATMWSAHSKIYTATRQDILSTVVLFDGGGVGGLTTRQLADYASIRSFATDFEAYPDTSASILSLFEGDGEKPAELTQSDMAFLTGLYSGIANLPRGFKLPGLERRLAAGSDD